MSQALDPLTFPLAGSQLIEASAGTGKTTAITRLYLRQVLGHGCHPLLPPQILVVTFTHAATEELRDRIRAQLTAAAGFFGDDPSADADAGDFLQRLRDAFDPAEWPDCARRLTRAAEWMDEAAIFTIHGWAHRMLREHAFASDSLFEQHLVSDLRPRQMQAVRDYWRCHLASLAPAEAAVVIDWCADPDALYQSIRPLLGGGERPDTPLPPAAAVAAGRRRRAAWLESLTAQPWVAWIAEFREAFRAADEANQIDRQSLKPANVEGWLKKLEAWATAPEPYPLDLGKGWERLTVEGLAGAWRTGEPPRTQLVLALPELKAALARPPDDGRLAFFAHAGDWIRQRFEADRQRANELGFDDLLGELDAGLAGEGGEALAAMIRERYPTVLIDEFQDTDPLQYRLFDRIYDIAANRPETAVVMIGDPKQSIYAFRGADIHTYLKARSACGERRHTLRTNYRAVTGMVEAVNALFAIAEGRPDGPGAFRFRRGDANPLPFEPALAAGRDDALIAPSPGHDAGQPPGSAPALTLWTLPEPDDDKAPAKGRDRDAMAAACASHIVRLLNAAQAGEAGFGDDTGWQRPLRPEDIAVLVNSRNEAALIRQAMRERGLRSVYLSDKDSVYATPQAAEMALCLRAVAEPDDPVALRSALATRSLGWTAAELDALNYDESALEAMIEHLRRLRRVWRRQGVLPMVHDLLHGFKVPARLLADPLAGERALTDWLHIAELLQQAGRGLDGEHALLRHLLEAIEAADDQAAGDAHQMRLESDAHLVRVVTVHKSKGLQYPVVFLPFATEGPQSGTGDAIVRWHDDEGRVSVSGHNDAEAGPAAAEAALAEAVRKLYVALTRAEYAAFVGICPRKTLPDSALASLLGDRPDDVQPTTGHWVIAPAPDTRAERYQGPAETPATQPGRRYTGTPRVDWWIASYSALRDRRAAMTTAARTETLLADESTPHRSAGAATAAEITICHRLPRGAATGSFLHDCLEWATRQGLRRLRDDASPLARRVEQGAQLRGWQDHASAISDWLWRVIATPLPLNDDVGAIALCETAAQVAELEFYLGASNGAIERLDTQITAATLGGAARPPLAHGKLNGLLKGFIDLVFVHQGRYYVLDYKSTWLGPDDQAYTPATIQAELLSRRYDLQSTLYLLALHRLLRVRLPDYDPDHHLGGAISLFLRGIDAPGAGVHVERPDPAVIDSLDRELGHD
ncbi:exodeoxyribonuclease V subunit beta [Spiribacter sp. 218]|uniref:exodeoxyribonuclease V subunit beta n=1 Tax=Spiribacter pallidus TaxID=1987936 RepID=UPI00349FBB1B